MNEKLGVVRDVALVSIGKYSQYVVTLITLPLSARLLGPSGMGLLAVAMSAYFLGALITDMGIMTFLAARVGDDDAGRLRASYAALRVTAVAVFGIATLIAHVFDTSPLLEMVTIGLFGGSLSAAGDDWVLLGLNKFGQLAVQQGTGRVVYLITLIIALPLAPSPHTAMLCLIGSSIVPVAWSWTWTCRRLGRPRNPEKPWTLLRLGAPVLLARLLENTYEQGAASLFSFTLSHRALGLFSASDRPLQAAGSLLDAIGFSLLPRMAHRRRAEVDFWGSTYRMIRAVALLGIFAAIGATVFAPWIVGLLFGDQFHEAVALLRVEAWALPGMAVASFISTAVLPVLSDTRGVVIGSAAGAAVAFVALGITAVNHDPMTLVCGIAAAETTAAVYYLARIRRLQRRGVAPTETVDANQEGS